MLRTVAVSPANACEFALKENPVETRRPSASRITDSFLVLAPDSARPACAARQEAPDAPGGHPQRQHRRAGNLRPALASRGQAVDLPPPRSPGCHPALCL